jgi:hypothetical protein
VTTIRSVTVQTNNGSSPTTTVVTPSDATAAQVGDVLLVIHGNDFYPAANMPTPTVSPGSPTLTPVPNGAADSGDTGAHIKSYTATVATAGAQTVSVTETGSADEEKVLVVYVLAGADAANPIDDAAATFGTSATPQPAPSVSPSTADALLICHNNSGGGASTASYITPGGMVEQYEIHVGGLSGVGATEQLVASGATGTRTFTAASSVQWAAVSIAIRSAATGGGTTANASAATATAAGNDAAAAVAPGAQAAMALAEALFDPGTSVSVELVADAPIEIQATAHDVTATVASSPAAALAAAVATDPSAVVAASAGLASAEAAAQDATVTTATGTTALAEAAAASGAALDAGAAVVASGGAATGSAAGLDAVAAVVVAAAAQAATASAVGVDPAAAVAPLAGAAAAVGVAADASGPGEPVPQVSVGGMRARVRRGPEMAGGRRRAAAMTGGRP